MFALISFLGWCAETIYFVIRWDDLTDRGFLTLPLCTIYGCSLIAIYLIIGTPKEGRLRTLFEKTNSLPRGKKILAQAALYLLYFVFAALIPTVAEFITALFFDKVFGIRLWDYSYHAYDLFGYVSLGMALLWGALITFGMSVIWPLLYKLVSKIPYRARKIFSIVFLVALFFDYIINFLYLCFYKKHLTLF